MLDHPYSDAAGSIMGEQTLHISLNHPLYRDDKKSFFTILEVPLRSTNYKASIKPFQRTNNGSGAYKALIAPHAGKYKWVKILPDAKTYVNERKWYVTTHYLPQSYIEKCRECYLDIENESEHVTEPVLNQRMRAQSLPNSIVGCTNPKICSRVAAVSN